MKKHLIFGVAALTMLASCSNEEKIDAPATSAIEFGNLFVNNSTRATDLTLANLENFKVYGFMGAPSGVVFDGETVSKTAGVWTYSNLQYWTGGKNYWFSAVAPATGAEWTYTASATEAAEYNGAGTIAFDNAAANGSQDLLYAWSGKVICETPSTMKPVGLTFNHLLSRVMFTFQNDLKHPNARIAVKNVKVSNAFGQGSIDMTKANPAWVASAQTLALTFADADGRIDINTNKSTGTNYFIPAEAAYSLTFDVELWQGEQLAAVYPHSVTMPKVTMLPGHSYNFVAKLNSENIDPSGALYPIEFDVTAVNGWITEADQEIPAK